MLAILLCLILLDGRQPDKAREVDLIELNHTEGYSQVILWQWSHDYCRYDTMGWWILQPRSQAPTSDKWFTRVGQYRSRLFRETWTDKDPERVNANLRPTETRERP